MQEYTPLDINKSVKDAFGDTEKSLKTIMSNFSGTAFPVNNLEEGMVCYRTDEGKAYRYKRGNWTPDNIELDKTPTEGSGKAVSSGGVKTYTDNKFKEANLYADGRLGEANQYADKKLTEAKTYVDQAIANITNGNEVSY